MTIRARNLLYALVPLALACAVSVGAGPHDKAPKASKGHHVDVEATLPAPIFSGGAMPVQWAGIIGPVPTDWFGLYAPEGPDTEAIEWSYVSCSQTASVARATGICGFVIPGTVPPGTYEIRLFSGAGARLSTSHKFDVLDGGVR